MNILSVVICMFFFSCINESEDTAPEELPNDAQALSLLLLNDDLNPAARMEIYYRLFKDSKYKNPEIANDYLDKLSVLAVSEDNPSYQGRYELSKGAILRNERKYEIAIVHFLRASELFQKSGDLLRTADALNEIGILFKNIEGYSQALPYYEKAVGIYSEAKDWKYLSRTLANMGTCYLRDGQRSEALKFFNNGINTVKKSQGDNEELTFFYSKVGNVYFAQKEYDKALNSYTEALSVKDVSDLQKHSIYINIANALNLKGDFTKSEDWLSKAHVLERNLSIDDTRLIQRLNIEGEFYQLQGKHQEAVKVFNQAIEVADKGVINEYFANTLDLISKSQRALADKNGKVAFDDVFRVEDLRKQQSALKEELAGQLDFKKLQVLLDKEIEIHYREVKQAKIDSERSTIIKTASACIAVFIMVLLGTTIYMRRKKLIYEGRIQKVRDLFNED
ncbi:tetratricopeptide repeat protein [Fulvivirga maritima]|uniref:tetratricopeptide repeat protein n=1 Tax=Fulvivirga maritima TaxID=2904247 RepID=UPI001F37F25C|nr:tetratricopeptide repeat protein [Fulvivirga maritima]UII26828.1 tetratricopeptide repeat protein [Fulvivirga maritima]